MVPQMQTVMVPQTCGPVAVCSPAACGPRPVCGVPANGGVLIPGPAETSQYQLHERLRRLEAEVLSLTNQVQNQNGRIGSH